jgi:mRNA (guanine-N7-)-methyltransferase
MMRKMHNDAKRSLIRHQVLRGALVLDVGCGRGGDLHKWKDKECILYGVDPDPEAILEATKRSKECGYESWTRFSVGDIHTAPMLPFDIVCYNFSFQYLFKSIEFLRSSLVEIANRVRIGGKLIGVVPDASYITKLPNKWSDSLGNTIDRGTFSNTNAQVGNMILFKVADGPYYSKGFVPEPLCYKEILFQEIGEMFELESWSRMIPAQTGLITDIYSQFIFRRV